VAVVDTALTAQENCRIEQQGAHDRCQIARRTLHDGLRHVAKVSSLVPLEDGNVKSFDNPPKTSDNELIARADAIHAAASAHADLFVKEGVQPGLLDTLASEIAALRKAKDAMTLARKQFTEATEALDLGLDDGDEAIAVLEGILATSPDAPVGALTALRQAKRIGPRVQADVAAATTTPPAPGVPNTAA
jgi:hypothetical protein